MLDTRHRSEILGPRRASRLGIAITIGAGTLWLGLGWPPAASAQRSGEAWDDRHMQSNSSRYFEPGPPRPPIRGSNRFEQSATNPTEAPPTTVPETTIEISQHEWAPGGAATGAARGPASSRSSISGGIRGSAAPSVSSGIQRSSSGRSSALRSTASSGQRSRRR